MIMLRKFALWLILGVTGLSAAACELVDVITPAGEDVLVVEGVLRAGESPQRILLHRTIDGRTIRGETGARVAVTTPEGREILFVEGSRETCLLLQPRDTADGRVEVESTCYRSPPGQGNFVVPGATYELRIETAQGERVRGRTQVPGAFTLRNPPLVLDQTIGGYACTIRPNTVLPLAWSPATGTWGYLSHMEIQGLRTALAGQGITRVPDPLRLTGVSISESDTTTLLPTNFGVFQRGELNQELLLILQRGLPSGVTAQVTIAAADRNYINSVRGGTFHPSGNVRISSVVGDGIGVFGSLVPLRLFVRSADSPTLREPFCLPS